MVKLPGFGRRNTLAASPARASRPHPAAVRATCACAWPPPTVANGVLVATNIKIKKTPGGASSASFTAMGTIGSFKSSADFKVKGQRVDASGPGVRLTNGSAASLSNGTKVTIIGDRIVDDVLIATQVTFD